MKLFLLFTLIPLIELYLLIKIAQVTSLWVSLAMIVIPGLIGATMVRRQGLMAWRRAREEMGRGGFPADSLLDGLILLVGGVLLITPGVLTDLAGLLTMIPPVRALIRARLKGWLARHVTLAAGGPGVFQVFQFGGGLKGADSSAASEAPRGEVPHRDPFVEQSPFDRLGRK